MTAPPDPADPDRADTGQADGEAEGRVYNVGGADWDEILAAGCG